MTDKTLKELILNAESPKDILFLFKNLGFDVHENIEESKILVTIAPEDILEIVFFDHISEAIFQAKSVSIGKFCTLGISRDFEEWIFIKRVIEDGVKLRKYKFSKSKLRETPKPIAIQKMIRFKFNELHTFDDLFERKDVTKKFYDDFKKLIESLRKSIKGIEDDHDKQWYASVLVNRILFVYFIQHKELLGDRDIQYLSNKLRDCKNRKGWAVNLPKNGHSYYSEFLIRLFLEGFAQRDRSNETRAILNIVPYLNGGLFQKHSLEIKYNNIQIPDSIFVEMFAYLDKWNWHLDERHDTDENEINPEVLGYIFEKFTNQKQMGAYYTKEDITGYICKNTIIPKLLDMVTGEQTFLSVYSQKLSTAFSLLFTGKNACATGNPNRYIYPSVQHGCSLPLPKEIEEGISDVSKRSKWNTLADERYGLPTEIWREVVARRKRLEDIQSKLKKGLSADGVSPFGINDLITMNLNIIQFALDLIENADIEFVNKFYESLQSITILDPTCGSGAFLLASLNILEDLYEACLVRLGHFDSGRLLSDVLSLSKDSPKDVSKHRSYSVTESNISIVEQDARSTNKYNIYKSIILNNLYGVDIMEEAVEICKLRLFLKLVSQVSRDDSKPNLGIEPLPDIDFNIHAGNTLIGYVSINEVESSIHGLNFQIEQLKAIQKHADNIDVIYDDFRKRQLDGHFDTQSDIECSEGTYRNADCYTSTSSVHRSVTKPSVAQVFLPVDNTKESSSESTQARMPVLPNTQSLKQTIQEKLDTLNNQLNQYMAKGIYGIDISNVDKYKKWLETHKPFHWIVNFYGILSKGGFDVIVGNPPYVEYSKKMNTGQKLIDQYLLKGYKAPLASNLYVFCIEKSISLKSNNGNFGMIVPVSAISGNKYKILNDILYSNKTNYISSYSNRPGKLFKGVEQRLSILLNIKGNNKIYSAGFNHWYESERDLLLDKIFYVENICNKSKFPSKIKDTTETKIINIIESSLLIQKEKGKFSLYFHDGPTYWIRAFSFNPEVKSDKSNHFHEVVFNDIESVYIYSAFLSSTFYYIYFKNISNCRDFSEEHLAFPIFNNNTNEQLVKLSKELKKGLQKNASNQKRIYNSGEVFYKEYYPALSKPIIDQIDKVLAQHYGFTDEELDYIINYDIKYRMGKESNSSILLEES